LDDLVLTGRIAVLRAAKGSTEVLLEHSSISLKWAAQYREARSIDRNSVREVISKINKEQKRKRG
jgi:hypothetical protein